MANHNDGMCPGFQEPSRVTRWHVPSAFFGIYLGRGRPSRSQVFTLELFSECATIRPEPADRAHPGSKRTLACSRQLRTHRRH
jgi:hypothetical protein